MITFTVPGQPQGKGRPRIGRVGAHARMFTPAKTVNYECMAAMAAHQAMAGRPLIEGAVRVDMTLDCQMPASWPVKKRARAAVGFVRPTTKPDADNVVKAVFDAMNGVVWRDDVQVCVLALVKRYADTPGVTVRVEALEEPQDAA